MHTELLFQKSPKIQKLLSLRFGEAHGESGQEPGLE
jgi:hypothetical protein